MKNTPESQQVSLEDAFNLAIAHMQASNYRVAELTFNDILKALPDHFESLYNLGLTLYYMDNIAESLDRLEQASKSKATTAEFWCNYGIILNEGGKREEALKALTRAVRKDTNYAPAWMNKSHIFWLDGRYKDAEKAARKAIEKDPKSPESWLNLGTALIRLDRQEEAAQAWEKALKLRPDYAFALNNLGNLRRDMGQLKEAEEKCRKALDLDPQYAQAMNNLANTLLDQGETTQAEEWYRKAITILPNYAEAHNNLCVCLMRQSRYDEAITHANYATSFDPNYVDAYIALGDALRTIGDLEKAEKAIQTAVRLRPESAEVHMDMADVLLMMDRYGDAEIELQKAHDLKQDSPRIYLKLANVLERANKIEEALEAIDKAVELNPEMPEAYISQGQIYHIANKSKEAKESFFKALELKPNMLSALISLAEIYQTTGDLKKSKEYVKKAQKISPYIPGLYVTLSKLKKFKKDDKDFKIMLELEKGIENRGLDQSAALNFALFSAYQDIGDDKKAFEHLTTANDYKRKTIPYQGEQQKDNFERIKKTYTRKYIKSFKGKGCDSDIPVFILGMPRSGTTLTEQIISSHPDVFGAGELSLLSALRSEYPTFTKENCKERGQRYVDEIKKLDPTGKALRITDKMPGNYSSIGEIVTILPHAKIIHCQRDPIDTCLSCYKQNFSRGQYWSYNLEELAAQHNLYRELMAYWRKTLPGQFLEIDYEETVGNFEEQARKLIDFIDMPWNDACLEPHKQKRTVLTASKTQVIKPIYKTSVKAWKRYEKQLQPLIKGLNDDETLNLPSST